MEGRSTADSGGLQQAQEEGSLDKYGFLGSHGWGKAELQAAVFIHRGRP